MTVPFQAFVPAGWWFRIAAPVVCALAIMAVPMAARAQDYPSIEPSRDAAVTYDVDSTATGAMRIEAFADPALQTLRLQLAGGTDFLLLDRATERVMLVSPDKGLVFVVPANGMLHRRLGPDSGLRFARAGHRIIAGVACAVWTVRGPDGSGQACVTQDGIILAGEGQGDRPAKQGQIQAGRLKAVTVSYAPLPASLFEAPSGLQEVDLPPSLFRAMIPGLAGISAP
jgi:hypothetical protein